MKFNFEKALTFVMKENNLLGTTRDARKIFGNK
jgi:hypothetical protein